MFTELNTCKVCSHDFETNCHNESTCLSCAYKQTKERVMFENHELDSFKFLVRRDIEKTLKKIEEPCYEYMRDDVHFYEAILEKLLKIEAENNTK